jgi:hypothetical protein
MTGMIFLTIAIAFLIVATLAAVATTSASRTVSGIAEKVVNGSFVVALVSVGLTAWFLFWPPL